MATAEEIRYFVSNNYIEPSRLNGQTVISIRLGGVRQRMKLANPLQSVRSALSTKLFQKQNGVELLTPVNQRAGANTTWHFRVFPNT